jgi:hypothetical protein
MFTGTGGAYRVALVLLGTLAILSTEVGAGIGLGNVSLCLSERD